jgi:hypothetical protein
MNGPLKKSYYPKRWLRIAGAVVLLASLSFFSFVLGILFQQTQTPPPVQTPNLPPVEEPVVSYPDDVEVSYPQAEMSLEY